MLMLAFRLSSVWIKAVAKAFIILILHSVVSACSLCLAFYFFVCVYFFSTFFFYFEFIFLRILSVAIL